MKKRDSGAIGMTLGWRVPASGCQENCSNTHADSANATLPLGLHAKLDVVAITQQETGPCHPQAFLEGLIDKAITLHLHAFQC